MARDGKLTFSWTYDNTAASGTGGLRIGNYAAAGTTAQAWIWNPSGGTNYNFQRAVSSALNKSGYRDQQADQSQIGTPNSIVSAISNDPSVFGQTEMYEGYVRVTYGQLGSALVANTNVWIVVEAASDSGTGTAGTDWSPISNSINLATPTSAQSRSVPTGTTLNGVFSSTAHGLAVGDIVVFTANAAGSGLTNTQPYFVSTVPNVNSFTLAATANGATIGTITGHTSWTAFATPAQRRVVSISVAPTVKPWLRVAVYGVSTGAAALPQYTGVWIQDAFVTLGRDSATLA